MRPIDAEALIAEINACIKANRVRSATVYVGGRFAE